MNLGEFLKYTKKADEIIIKALAETHFSIPEANTLISHVLSAQHIWAKRILGEKPDYAVWEVLRPEDFESIYQTNIKMLEEILATKVLTEEVMYGNSAGNGFTNTIEDILIHVCNHGTYHRGQLAKMLKQAGYVPPVTDYIILKRQGML
jgi:uncharacterized damage-inducible protein DinB